MGETGEVLVVYNAAAARARKAWPSVGHALARAGVGADVREAVRPGETESRTREALAEGREIVAVIGGDGTLSAAASGFFRPAEETPPGDLPRPVNPSAALSVLPAGTGDDFARGLTGGRREPLSAWVERLVRHARSKGDEGAAVRPGATPRADETTRLVDVMWCSAGAGARRFLCLNAATLGIGAEVAARVAAQGRAVRRMPGEARFGLAALAALAAWRERRVRVCVDGGPWRECLTNVLGVVNGTHAGGGMNFSPGARVDDGRLDLVTACGLSFPEVLRELARIHRSGHLRNPKVRVERGGHVSVETLDPDDALGVEADGDVRGRTPAEFRVMPRALRVVW